MTLPVNELGFADISVSLFLWKLAENSKIWKTFISLSKMMCQDLRKRESFFVWSRLAGNHTFPSIHITQGPFIYNVSNYILGVFLNHPPIPQPMRRTILKKLNTEWPEKKFKFSQLWFRIIHKLFYQKDAFDFMLSKTHRVELINLGPTFIPRQ